MKDRQKKQIDGKGRQKGWTAETDRHKRQIDETEGHAERIDRNMGQTYRQGGWKAEQTDKQRDRPTARMDKWGGQLLYGVKRARHVLT